MSFGHTCWVARYGLRARPLGQHHRLGVEGGYAGIGLHDGETLRQRGPASPAGAPVVYVDRHPVDVSVTRIERALVDACRVPDVRVPYELNVGRAGQGETVVDVAERRDVLRRRVSVYGIAPRVPVAIHLVPEIKQHGGAITAKANGP